jgi:hypothetical protein
MEAAVAERTGFPSALPLAFFAVFLLVVTAVKNSKSQTLTVRHKGCPP